MARTFLTPIDLNKNELQNAVLQPLASAPASPKLGQLYFNSGDNTIYVCTNPTGPVWTPLSTGSVPDATTGSKGIIQLAGDLAGTAATPVVAAGAITDAKLAGSISNAKLATNPLARANHTGTQLAATISDFDTQVRTSRLDQMAAPTADVSLGSHKLTNVTDPTVAQDAATKAYVDNTAAGLDAKPSVRVASSTNINTASPGAAIDGVSMNAGDRVLLRGQSTSNQNGIWVWNGAASAMTRATDADAWTELVSAYVWVEQGSDADTGWVSTVDAGGTLNTTAVTFVQFAASTTIEAGSGLVRGSGNTFDVNVDNATVEVNADTVRVKDLGITNAKIANATIDLTTKVTGILPVANGGTGSGTAGGARAALSATGKYAADLTTSARSTTR
jgi:hypothetical protein